MIEMRWRYVSFVDGKGDSVKALALEYRCRILSAGVGVAWTEWTEVKSEDDDLVHIQHAY